MTVATLEMRGISKQFGGRYANEHVDFAVMPGEIHALIGENGAGKTTLMNIASGLYRQDEGHVLVEGDTRDWADPLEALEGGVAMVHQTFMLVDTLTVAENVALGSRKGLGHSSRDQLAQEIVAVADEFGIPMGRASDTGVNWTSRRGRDLSPSEKQRVAILSALYRHSKLLILDEPTSVLSPEETKSFFDVLRKLKAAGLAIVFISHKVREVLELCDKVTVMRGGRVVAAANVDELDDESLAALMVGRDIHPALRTTSTVRPTEVLRVSDLWAKGDRGAWALKGVGLSLRQGEILGVAGVDGSGQHELVECLAGLRPWERGDVEFVGTGSSAGGPRRVSHVPANPRREGLILDSDAAWNIGLRHIDEPEARRAWGLIVNTGYFSRLADRLISDYDVRNCRPTTRVADLSGGNLQKLLLGRELTLPRDVALVVNPTTGLDIGAIETIRKQILRSAESGTAILLVSNELEELLALSDRIAVFYNGEIAGEIDRAHADRGSIGRLMSGLHRE
ncbi:ABC transporter ATP-binding protein [Micromonospora inyonensis]|uniref:Nucleoside ABC transporter ATP-binding protein n=1 Tax=Micromonospora inyonensis TaxID=47866 RepID=A0A1C6SD44_9ACTN|nr:ABC transporter ATP-binding protein [Micromonospora inyonensis]SCL27418.1 nucleoside ABC transporter ATP-binding protein [Micromonospora inyonensis]